MTFHHIPILADEIIDLLQINNSDIVLDCTAGSGGHSELILKQNPKNLILNDQDIDAIKHLIEKFKEAKNIEIIQGSFFDLPQKLKNQQINKILIDLGISSYQIDTPQRGFSFQQDGPLDMRMNQNQELTADIVINSYSEPELSQIFFEYGEEPKAKILAKKIIEDRKSTPFISTVQFANFIQNTIYGSYEQKQKSIRKIFQAIRIEVNQELSLLENAVNNLIKLLAPNGRLAILTFHSLEDRIVKKIIQKNLSSCTCPPNFPICTCNQKPSLKKISHKAITPSEKELKLNTRAKSAKLRVVEKLE